MRTSRFPCALWRGDRRDPFFFVLIENRLLPAATTAQLRLSKITMRARMLLHLLLIFLLACFAGPHLLRREHCPWPDWTCASTPIIPHYVALAPWCLRLLILVSCRLSRNFGWRCRRFLVRSCLRSSVALLFRLRRVCLRDSNGLACSPSVSVPAAAAAADSLLPLGTRGIGWPGF